MPKIQTGDLVQIFSKPKNDPLWYPMSMDPTLNGFGRVLCVRTDGSIHFMRVKLLNTKLGCWWYKECNLKFISRPDCRLNDSVAYTKNLKVPTPNSEVTVKTTSAPSSETISMIHNPIPKIEYVLLLDNTRMSSYSNDQLLEKIQVLEKDREELNKLTTKNKILDERLSSINTALQQIAKELNDRFYAS